MPEITEVPQATVAAAEATVATPAVTQEKAEPTLREALASQFDKSREAPTIASQGKTPEATVADPGKPPAEEPPKEGQAPKAAQETAAEAKLRTDQIPVGWKGTAQDWHSVPPSAKQYIVERNRQYDQGIQKHAEAAKWASAMAQEFTPYQAMLSSLQASPIDAARFLMSGYYKLRAGTPAERRQVLMGLAQDAGIDLGALAGDGEQQPHQPTEEQRYIAQLAAQVREVQGYLQQQQHSVKSSEQQHINSQIDGFAADPAHPHFDTVRPMMAALLGNGQAKDLNEAYELACWAHPEVRASLVNQHNAQDAEKRKKQADAAQAASVSVTGAPPGPATGGDLSIRGLLEKQFATGGRI